MNWRKAAPRLSEWHAEIMKRPSFNLTEPIDG